MKTYTAQQLKEILDGHYKWLNNNGGERANLSYANLSYANLSDAKLIGVNLMTFQFQKHVAYYSFDGTLSIGCLVMPITEWHLGFKEIGESHGYNEEQIEEYGFFIKKCLTKFKKGSK